MKKRRQSFTQKTLQQLADKHRFTEQNQAIEDKRCQTDLMYALFQRPHTVLPRLLPGMLALIERKHSPDLGSDPMFCDARKFLLADGADDHIKVFMILMIINRDCESHAILKDGYLDGSLWGDEMAGQAHFERFLDPLAQLVDGLFNAPFGEANVINRVFEFVVGAKIQYLCK